MQEKYPHFFHSTLIVGANPNRRKERALKLAATELGLLFEKSGGIDFFEVGGELKQTSISIEEIRKLQSQLAAKPYQAPKKVALIFESQRMTLSAQNCLLKTLEEPPDHSLLILTANDNGSLLPTVRSRCRLIELGPVSYEEKKDQGAGILELLQKNQGQRLLWVEENKKILESREEVLSFLDSWLVALREVLINLMPMNPKGLRRQSLRVEETHREAIRQILTAKKTVAAVNVNLRLALEVLLLHLPQTKPEGFAAAIPSG